MKVHGECPRCGQDFCFQDRLHVRPMARITIGCQWPCDSDPWIGICHHCGSSLTVVLRDSVIIAFGIEGDTPKPAACDHLDFTVNADITPIMRDDQKVWMAQFEASCALCGLRFVFEGLPRAINPYEPSSGIAGLRATLPIRPFRESDGQSEPLRVVFPERGTL